AYGLQGWRWTDDKPWQYKLQFSLETESPEDAQAMYPLEEIHRSRMQIVEPMQRLHHRLQEANTVEAMLAGLFEFLDEMNVDEHLDLWSSLALQEGDPDLANQHKQVWERIVHLFEQMVETIGTQECDIAQFADLLEAGFEQMQLAL